MGSPRMLWISYCEKQTKQTNKQTTNRTYKYNQAVATTGGLGWVYAGNDHPLLTCLFLGGNTSLRSPAMPLGESIALPFALVAEIARPVEHLASPLPFRGLGGAFFFVPPPGADIVLSEAATGRLGSNGSSPLAGMLRDPGSSCGRDGQKECAGREQKGGTEGGGRRREIEGWITR